VKQKSRTFPGFRPLSEAQIVTQLVQNKKWEELEAREAMTQLCKKLAEKRVFGPKLMANTTVAGPNHSTYNNLPCEGIIYIQGCMSGGKGGDTTKDALMQPDLVALFQYSSHFHSKGETPFRCLSSNCRSQTALD
jgi:hypothetical protein